MLLLCLNLMQKKKKEKKKMFQFLLADANGAG